MRKIILNTSLLFYAMASFSIFILSIFKFNYVEFSIVRFVLFLVLPLLGGAFFLLFLIFSEKYKSIISIYTGSILVGAFSASVYLEMTNDVRSVAEVVAEMKEKGVKAYPLAVPRVMRRLVPSSKDGHVKGLPILSSISNVTTVVCNETGQFLITKLDEHGFNNPQGLWGKENIEVIFVGDSFTFGFCEPIDENVPSLIRNKIPNTINLGMPSSGPLAQLGTLIEYAKPKKPKYVIWMYFELNDLLDLKGEARHLDLKQYLDNPGETSFDLINRQAEIDVLSKAALNDQFSAKFKNVKTRSKILSVLLLRMLRERLNLSIKGSVTRTPFYDAKSDDFELFEKIIKISISEVENWGGEFIFVYLPAWMSFGNPHANSEAIRNKILEIVKRQNIKIINIHDLFSKQSRPVNLYNAVQGHFNAEGYSMTAKEIIPLLSLKN